VKRLISKGLALALGVGLIASSPRASDAQSPPRPPARIDFDGIINEAHVANGNNNDAAEPGGTRFRDFAAVTKGAEKVDGLFTLYHKGENLYAEIRNDQFNQPLLLPVTIARGMAQAGMPVGDDDMVLIFRRVGDKVQLVRRNIHYKAPSGTPLEKSVRQNYVDSILMALPIVAINRGNGSNVLIDFSEIFLTDFAQLGLGSMDRSRSSWSRVKGFANNLELEVEATFGGGRWFAPMLGGDDGVADQRGITLVIHYSLMKAPDSGYHPRTADDRVGHFLTASKDFGKADADTNFVRNITRWRLEKADAHADPSPPKKQIIWYIEDTVPVEYRPFVEAGIREWNKAFEKIGFVEAIAVRWQEAGRDDFDPEDTNYCTFRWVTSDAGYAMSCLRANPLTGEMIDGDVVFDASFIRAWKQEYALLVATGATLDGRPHASALAIGEVISPILAARMGYGHPAAGNALPGASGLLGDRDKLVAEAIPATHGGLRWQVGRRLAESPSGACRLHGGMSRDFGLASIAFADPEKDKDKDGKEKDKDDKKKRKDELPRDFVGQAIKHIVMHEVGHSLGLRHNFKASTMLTADQLNDPAITRVKGLVGSVMDYSPINIAPRGRKQGDYYSTTLGPYDHWAIEYAYKEVDGDEGEALKAIAARAPEPDLEFATDEDMFSNGDPRVNVWDLGSDPCQFAKDRIELATNLMKELDGKVVKDGESWARTRRAFAILLGQWGDAAILASQYVGGQSVARDHKGDKNGRDPIVPISGAKQRECLKFVVDQILSDRSFKYSPALLRRLGAEKWMHWGSTGGWGTGVDISVLETILSIQKIALGHCLNPGTLNRVQNQQLQADAGADPLRSEEIFRSLTDGIWADPGLDKDPKAGSVVSSTIRRNLQREYLRRLSTMVLGGTHRESFGDRFAYIVVRRGGDEVVPADARSLARLHLGEIADRIDQTLARKDAAIDDTTRAHLKESRQRIGKVLEANLDVREP